MQSQFSGGRIAFSKNKAVTIGRAHAKKERERELWSIACTIYQKPPLRMDHRCKCKAIELYTHTIVEGNAGRTLCDDELSKDLTVIYL